VRKKYLEQYLCTVYGRFCGLSASVSFTHRHTSQGAAAPAGKAIFFGQLLNFSGGREQPKMNKKSFYF